MLPMLDQKAITVIFANVEDILLTNTVSETCIFFGFWRLLSLFADTSELARRATKRMSALR